VDKRTITALLLITVLIFVYTMLTKRTTKPQENAVQTEEKKIEPKKGEESQKNEIVDAGESKGEKVVAETTETPHEEKMIKVRTKLFSVEFSTLGATLQDMQLLNYPGEGDKPVQLIPEGGNPLALSILEEGKTVDLSQFPTICERDSIDLTSGVKDSLVFYYVKNDTTFLKKVFIFTPDSYIINLHIEFPKKVKHSLRLSFDTGLASTEKDKRDELAYTFFVAMFGDHFERSGLKKVKEEKSSIEGRINWTGITSKYFLFFVMPEDTIIKKVSQWKIEKKKIGISVSTGDIESADFSLYFGPLDYNLLKKMGNGLEQSVYFGWQWIAPISKVIFFIFIGIHKVIANYGIVIIIFSTIMMVVFFPLTIRSFSSMRRMQKLQPKMEAIRKKFKDDPKKMNAEIMKLYSQNKVNPVGGCLPLIFQMPVFFALYAVLRSTIELRRTPFVFWISDLSMKDPFYVLPILMGIAMFFQQKFTVTDPKQKAMTYFMPIFLVFIFSRLPSGIVLYWLVYNLLSIAQQYIIHRNEKKETETVGEPGKNEIS